MARFVPWLRDGAGLRTAAVVAAAEAAKALLETGQPGGRQLIAGTLRRADEPGELLAYWMSRYGRAIPKPVKRGIGDTTFRLLTEYPLLKYDTAAHAFRFADVLALVHAGDGRAARRAAGSAARGSATCSATPWTGGTAGTRCLTRCAWSRRTSGCAQRRPAIRPCCSTVTGSVRRA